MAEMSWTVSIQISGGPNLSASSAPQSVEATDRVAVTLAAGDSDRVIELQPGAASAIRLILIKSSRYGAEFTAKASDGVTDSEPVTLDGPQVLTAGTAALLGVAPQQLKLSNASADQDIEIEVFVARDATPS
ncbi:hypothetical protein Thimo_0778 [Thioflavicoccus mobilis 8321]|uniref:Uncharacterized protein n=1 Tax=Thioflavicoccus mobilis 8321 TaxID=765912 RepID=L0GUW6_9GAMM|nr:hypothetical protein [Thioflavicoccus mobilis]AGA89617.1 hypothetical protein Thimo_0778 [Thioflavicoccus mobilis 8321]